MIIIITFKNTVTFTISVGGVIMVGMKRDIVIIEDDLNIAKAQQLILQGEFNVHLAHDGEAGLKKVNQIKPALVVLDLMIPKKDGYNVCREIRANTSLKDIKVVMVTAKNNADDETKGLDLGADDYIMKPFEATELKHVIHQVLNKR